MSLRDHRCVLNKQTGEVVFNDKVILLRPKTFELLLFLASNPNAIHSKADILASVWTGSIVEDQVIFQSINEIRKEFGLPEAIKTYPRRGYKLEIAISLVDDLVTEPVISKAFNVQIKRKGLWLFALPLLVAIILSVTYLTRQNNHEETHSNVVSHLAQPHGQRHSHKGILVLPFNVASLDESQHWLRYGAMEGLIKRISPNENTTLFHLEDVIEILNRIDIDERDQINQIFAKSGANYILQTSLSGQPGELNVVYTIYSRTNRITRTLQASTLKQLLNSLATIFEQSQNEVTSLEVNSIEQQLQNDLIAKAMQLLEVNDLNSALSFIKSAVINDPNNIVAAYLLVKTYMESSQINEGMIAIDNALKKMHEPAFNEYAHRLFYFQGAGFAALGKLPQAQDALLKSQKLSQDKKDWLYYAYSQSILAKIKQAQKHYQEAYPLLHSALEYQELLNCPLGITQGYLDFAEYYLATGNVTLAQQNFEKAKTFAQTKNLQQVFPLLSEVEKKLK